MTRFEIHLILVLFSSDVWYLVSENKSSYYSFRYLDIDSWFVDVLSYAPIFFLRNILRQPRVSACLFSENFLNTFSFLFFNTPLPPPRYVDLITMIEQLTGLNSFFQDSFIWLTQEQHRYVNCQCIGIRHMLIIPPPTICCHPNTHTRTYSKTF